MKNVKDKISRPLGSQEIQQTKVCTVVFPKYSSKTHNHKDVFKYFVKAHNIKGVRKMSALETIIPLK